MSIRYKILWVLLAIVATFVVIDQFVQRRIVLGPFRRLEGSAAKLDMRRVVAAIEEQNSVLLGQVNAILETTSDDPDLIKAEPRVVEGLSGSARLEQYMQASLDEERYDLAFFCDAEGFVQFGKILEPGTRKPLSLRDFPNGQLAPFNPIVLDAEQGKGALSSTEHGLLFVASRRMNGRLVVLGKFFDEDLKAELGQLAQVDFDCFSVEGDLPARLKKRLPEINQSTEPVVDRVEITAEQEAAGQTGFHAYKVLEGLRGYPSIAVRANLDQEIFNAGFQTMQSALLSGVGAAILILLSLLIVLRKTVVSPLVELTAHAVEVGENDDTSIQLGMQRSDEIGVLATEFDRMVGRLAESRGQLINAARLAGKSDVATGVLHNVGNVLNSVNVSSTLLANGLEGLALSDLAQAVEVLEDHKEDLGHFVTEDEQGKHFLAFLGEISSDLQKQRVELREEISSLGSGVRHMSELVRSQQSFAGNGGLFEEVSLQPQINAAINIVRQSIPDGEPVEFVREFEELEDVVTDRQRLLEILVNLIQNACQASIGLRAGEKHICVAAQKRDEVVRIEVRDRGVGIAPENLARVFVQGFTTREGGHGFGLHTSANAATEMGGRLYAESEGEGKGAQFILELPATREARKAA